MKKDMFFFLFAILCISLTANAQTNKYWTTHTDVQKINTDKSVSRISFPEDFFLFDLDIAPLKRALLSITDRNAARTVISLPNAVGALEQFEISEASNFEPDLQAMFPEIRAYSGKGITDKYATLKLSLSPQGIQTMVFRTDRANEFIEAYSADHTVYAVFRSQRKKGQLPWACTTTEQQMFSNLNTQINKPSSTLSSTGELKTMRLVQSCNGEYANYFGATSAAQESLVMAAYNATLTRCNGVYERDLALHLNLIASTTNVIYYNPSTDPYSTTLSQWNLQLQQTLTSVIGSTNYDIGHMFGASGGGGNAGCIGCVCVDPATSTTLAKGSGITSPNDGIPMGDNFDIDYVAHEVGHQLGANHTFSHSLEGTGVNKEVGSGITIMGYAGITNQDVANHSIDIFHQASIAQIQANLATKTCPITTNISGNNATPVISPVSNYTIPISTPFALTGSATDANGDPLTYCWEQNDNSTTSGNNSVASPTKATGPNWLSFTPSTSPTRLFPRLSTILAGLNVTPTLPGGDAIANIEALSSVSRTLNFRLTVRDNSTYVVSPPKIGQTAFTDMVVTVSNTSGPFTVTQPNTNLSWPASSAQTVTWNVANTTASPVSCVNVKISMSIDGGQSFPYILEASTTNDGSQLVNIPAVAATTTARIKVEAVGNIFFDISNTNFTITSATPGFDFDSPPATSIACGGPTSANITLGTISYFSYAVPINLSAAGVPAGTSLSYGTNPVIPGNSSVITLNNTQTLSAGSYNITITGISGSITKTRIITYTVNAGTGPGISTHPSGQQVCVGTGAIFSVTTTGSVLSYQWQLSTDGGTVYNNISNTNANTYTISSALLSQNNNRYRVLITGPCNTSTSNAAVLSVNNAPAVPVLTPPSATICTGEILALSASSKTINILQSGTAANSNNTSGSTAFPAPYTAWYGGQRMQMLILASELSTAGFSTGSRISEIQFPVVSLGSAWGNTITSLQSFKVSIGPTALNTISSFQSGLTTLVAAGNFTPVIGYTNTHSFTSDYIWNGNSNIIIETTFSNGITGTTSTTVTQYNSPTAFQSTIVYRADGVSAATAASATTVNYSYSARPDLKLNGKTLSGITWSPLSNLYKDAAASIAYNGDTATTIYTKHNTPGTPVYSATATIGGCSVSSNANITVNSCSSTLNLKLFLQGFYIGNSTMASTLYNLGMSANPAATDQITVNLWAPESLSSPTPGFTATTVLSDTGTASIQFPAAVIGHSYYIAIKHRNSMETWSKTPVLFNSVVNYDFSNALIKAYDDGINAPMKMMQSGVFALYSADVNNDGSIDATDMAEIDNDIGIFAFGYNDTDATGDGATDASDISIADNNIQLFLFYARPY